MSIISRDVVVLVVVIGGEVPLGGGANDFSFAHGKSQEKRRNELTQVFLVSALLYRFTRLKVMF